MLVLVSRRCVTMGYVMVKDQEEKIIISELKNSHTGFGIISYFYNIMNGELTVISSEKKLEKPCFFPGP